MSDALTPSLSRGERGRRIEFLGHPMTLSAPTIRLAQNLTLLLRQGK